ncbi:MAG TPA: hypothetical protein VMB79_14385 [Jatrophihabitans sp.]|nr:hypothetical protein [Jatrophihabitans sp.]
MAGSVLHPARPAPPAGGRRHRRPLLAMLAAFVALTALGGALGLLTGLLDAGPVITARLPWASPVAAGLALLAVVGLPGTVLGVLAVRGDRWADAAAVVAGTLLAGWIVVELVVIEEFSLFHPLYLGIGLLLVWAGRRALPGRSHG